MSFFKRIGDFASTAYDATKSFFSSSKFDTARTIAEGAGNVVSSMREALGRSGIQDFQPQGLVNPQTNLAGRVGAPSRSTAGRPSFGDVREASYYKYAQLQNTIRYLYGTKSRYKSIAKDK